MDDKTLIILIYLGYIFLLSLFTFVAYWLDKKKAQRGAWRIKEATLLLMSFIGGALGGFIAMKKFRHKTTREHWYFTAINVLSILCHLALLVFIFIKL